MLGMMETLKKNEKKNFGEKLRPSPYRDRHPYKTQPPGPSGEQEGGVLDK